ncbi:MAG: carboxymuconolactone decarboxylase family protein [Pseudomonadota bacterium]
MTKARIVPLDAPYQESVARAFGSFLPPGLEPLKLFRTQAHNPRVLERMFAGNLLDKGTIDMRSRELIILRTCARCGSEYEWGVHVALFGKHAALSEADIAATLGKGQCGLSVQEALLFKAVDELHDTSTISDDVWSALEQHYAAPQIIEIIALVGMYHAVSFMTNATGVELESFAPRFS